MGYATEIATVLNDKPFRADGLTAAARTALQKAKVTMANVDFRISDTAGESYGFREQSLLVTRLLRERKEDFELWHPAEYTGCSGAASGVVQLVVLEDAFRHGYAPGPRVLSCSSEASGERAVVLLQGTNCVADIVGEDAPNRVAL